MTEDDEHWIEAIDEAWCSGCYEYHGIYCDHCARTAPSEGSGTVETDERQREQVWCESCVDSEAIRCERGGCSTVASRDACYVVGDESCESWCSDCYEEYGFYCDHRSSPTSSDPSASWSSSQWSQ